MTAAAPGSDPFQIPPFDAREPFRPIDRFAAERKNKVGKTTNEVDKTYQDVFAIEGILLERFAQSVSIDPRELQTRLDEPHHLDRDANASRSVFAGPSRITLDELDAWEKYGPDHTASRAPALSNIASWDTWHRDATDGLERLSNRFATDTDLRNSQSEAALSEALVQSVNSKSPESEQNGAIDTAHDVTQVLRCLVQTAAGFTSSLFAWENGAKRFEWAWVVRRKEKIKRHKALKKRMEAELDKFEDDIDLALLIDEDPVEDLAAHSDQRILGMTAASTHCLVRRFLSIGTLQRRLALRVEEICRPYQYDTETGERVEAVGELHLLSSSLATTLIWVAAELKRWAEAILREHPQATSPMRAWAELEGMETLLEGLATMLLCSSRDQYPFPPLFPSRESRSISRSPSNQVAQILSLIYAQLEAHDRTASSPIAVGVMRFLLDSTTMVWRKKVAEWIGWPFLTDLVKQDGLELAIALDNERRHAKYGSANKARKALCRYEPWAGVDVEWDWDEQGELDVGYVLRPKRLPSFVPLSDARDILEGGRALRLLQRAAPSDHPLLEFIQGVSRHRRAIPVPKWIWEKTEAKVGLLEVEELVCELRQDIVRWRHGRTSLRKSKASSAFKQKQGGTTERSRRVARPVPADGLGLPDALHMFDDLPGTAQVAEGIPTESLVSTDAGISALTDHIGAAVESTGTSGPHWAPCNEELADVTRQSVLVPFLHWSRLLNTTLISVYFSDLRVLQYFNVCKEFLLLGNVHFTERLCSILFTCRQEDSDDDETGLLSASGDGLSPPLASDTSWPPAQSTFPTTLNAIVLESLAEMRHDESFEIEKPTDRQRRASRAQDDLQERLSFFVAEPLSARSSRQQRNTIDGLDWLSLAFNPPPLIAPLMTPQTQHSYQRIFNYLLRLLRVESVVKTNYRRLVSRGRNTSSMWLYESDPDQAQLLLFHHEAQTFVQALLYHTTEVVIKSRWQTFCSRLQHVHREAERDMSYGSAEKKDEDLMINQHNASDTTRGIQTDIDTIDGRPSTPFPTLHLGRSPNKQRENVPIKDVFSLAAYHDYTLGRMLDEMFLRSGQRVVRELIRDLMNAILELGNLIKSRLEQASASSVVSQAVKKSLHAFQSKRLLLLHALEALTQQDTLVGHLDVACSNTQQPRRNTLRGHAAKARPGTFDVEIDAEKARQAAEERHDMHELERKRINQGMSAVDVETVRGLIVALGGQ